MQTSEMVIGGIVLLLVLRNNNRRTQAIQAAARSEYDYLHDPTTWGADQWARLYADDLLPTDAQSSFTIYAATGQANVGQVTGFNGVVGVREHGGVL